VGTLVYALRAVVEEEALKFLEFFLEAKYIHVVIATNI
jgi:predicted nucleic acid-binding OB-fold protein